MNTAELRNSFLKVSIPVSAEEKSIFNDFFKRHPKLKKGETVKEWILSAIDAQESIKKGNSQVNVEAIR